MSRRRVLGVALFALAAMTLAVCVVALALGVGPVQAKFMSISYDGAGDSASRSASIDHPPFRQQIDLAVDAGPLDRERLVNALRQSLEGWFGPGNIWVVAMPQAGDSVSRPLLAIRVSGTVGTWSPLEAHSDLHFVAVAVDPLAEIHWAADALDNHRHRDVRPNDPDYNLVDCESDLRVNASGWVPLRAYQADLEAHIAQPVVEAIVNYAQQKAPPDRVPAPAETSPLSVDHSRPFTLHCDGQDWPFHVTYRDGQWGRLYTSHYVQDQVCDWEFTVKNTAGHSLTLGTWSQLRDQIPLEATFGAAVCRADATASWGDCTGPILAPGGTIEVRVPMRYADCERYQAGGGFEFGLMQSVTVSSAFGSETATLPWSVRLFVEHPPDAVCPGRFPLPATRVALANWLEQTLDPAWTAGPSIHTIKATDLEFKNDVFGNWLTPIYPDRLSNFVLRLPNRSCVGLVRFRREPDDWAMLPTVSGQPLFSEVLVSRGVMCVDNDQLIADKGAAYRVVLHGANGESASVAVGLSNDPRAVYANMTDADGHEHFADIDGGVFVVNPHDPKLESLPLWQIDLKAAIRGAEPLGRLNITPSALVPAATGHSP